MQRRTLLLSLLSPLVLGMAQAASAAQEAPDAFVKRVADALIKELIAKRAAYKKDPTVLNGIVKTYIEPNVDFDGFAVGAMGKYGRIATPAQKATFTKTFKEALLRTYTGTLAAFDNESYKLRPYIAGNKPNKAVVTMDFITDQKKVIPVTYQMVNINGNWKVRNVHLNGIDVGLSFANEFSQTVVKYKGDLDQAIVNFVPKNAAK